ALQALAQALERDEVGMGGLHLLEQADDLLVVVIAVPGDLDLVFRVVALAAVLGGGGVLRERGRGGEGGDGQECANLHWLPLSDSSISMPVVPNSSVRSWASSVEPSPASTSHSARMVSPGARLSARVMVEPLRSLSRGRSSA